MDSLNTTFIRYDPERVDYALTGEELENLQNNTQSNWKDFSIGSIAVGIPCTINAFTELGKQTIFEPTLSFNINLVIGILGLVLGSIFFILWRKSKRDNLLLLEKIKNKPKISIVSFNAKINKIELDVNTLIDQQIKE